MTKETKHTPAPWRISSVPRSPYLIYGSNNYAVADCKVFHGKTNIKADMTLIAAAPDLLREMENLVKALEDTGHDAPQSCFDAINKARGIS